MGRRLTFFVIVWIAVLAVCATQAYHWYQVEDDYSSRPFERSPEDRSMTPEEYDTRNHADRMLGAWTAGGVLVGMTGYFGFLRMRVRQQAERRRAEGRFPHPGRPRKRAYRDARRRMLEKDRPKGKE